MLATKRLTGLLCIVGVALTFGGCAGDLLGPGTIAKHYRRAKSERAVARREEPAKIDTGSVDKDATPVTSKDDPRWHWCEQRHLDYQAGKAPGGATDLEKKLEDDRICAAVYQRG